MDITQEIYGFKSSRTADGTGSRRRDQRVGAGRNRTGSKVETTKGPISDALNAAAASLSRGDRPAEAGR